MTQNPKHLQNVSANSQSEYLTFWISEITFLSFLLLPRPGSFLKTKVDRVKNYTVEAGDRRGRRAGHVSTGALTRPSYSTSDAIWIPTLRLSCTRDGVELRVLVDVLSGKASRHLFICAFVWLEPSPLWCPCCATVPFRTL